MKGDRKNRNTAFVPRLLRLIFLKKEKPKKTEDFIQLHRAPLSTH